ncbi:hypothetical protein FOZ63_016304 [Perkinsus olseni]|uniref:M-phase phosphoprotein 6 n=1 Tax=Perkinsus olseni TaxID=32597 RepID=A0A7J6S587_PEROL|nr:hypothetical protein FOZ62_015250 [Perkinsus olseni]KAF4736715.1 hypothetical protein FOZ63_016304 [Perkinsus olseni]
MTDSKAASAQQPLTADDSAGLSSAVSKLRFMSRGAELTAKQKLEQEQRAIRKRLEWSVPGFKDTKSAEVQIRQPGEPLKQVVLHGRRSYGGFNPYVESMMAEVTKRSSKLKRKRIG